MSYTLAIRCNACGMVSWNPGDVANRYCAKCCKFHDGAMQPAQFDERQRLIERVGELEERLSESELSRMSWAFRAGIATGVAGKHSRDAVREIAEFTNSTSGQKPE